MKVLFTTNPAKIERYENMMIKFIFEKENNRAVAYDNTIQGGECDFLETENYWNIVHTEVNNEYQGQGIARKLVECIIENAKKENKKLIAECSYAKKILEKHGKI